MSKIKQVLQAIDETVNRVQPKTMDELISTVHSVEGAENYGSHFYIVKYMGYQQGIRVAIIGRSKTHLLPAKDKVYAVHQDIEKYEKAGYPVVGPVGIEPIANIE